MSKKKSDRYKQESLSIFVGKDEYQWKIRKISYLKLLKKLIKKGFQVYIDKSRWQNKKDKRK